MNLKLPTLVLKMFASVNKFGRDMKCDLWKSSLPPVSGTFYYNKHAPHRDIKEGLRSPNIGLNRDYHHSQKHVSEKFQQILHIEKIKSEETSNAFNLQNQSVHNFNGRIEGSGFKKKYLADGEPWRKRYLDEWSEHAKQTYVHESDNEGRHHYLKGMNTLHGSQCFQQENGLLEVLKKHKHNGENRGHSIGYNQNSTDSNGLAGSGKNL